MTKTNPSLAMVLCIRDEATFLAAHLTYHRALGVDRAYIFLDRCTDGSDLIAQAFDWATLIPRDRDPDDQYMSAHQVKCLDDALAMARAEGIDWLMHIDPDEFACGDNLPLPFHRFVPRQQRLARANLPAMLARVKPATEQVIMLPKDVIPTPTPAGTPFWRLPYFQHRGALRRSMLNPVTGEIVRFTKRLGHYKGKSIVRTTADVQAASAHHWVRSPQDDQHTDRAIPTERCGFHYHYVVTDAARWLDKHRKFAEYPDHWEKGTPVRFPKQAWKEASLWMSPAEAERYFARWIAVPRRRLLLPMVRGAVVYDPFVEQVLADCGFGAVESHRSQESTQ